MLVKLDDESQSPLGGVLILTKTTKPASKESPEEVSIPARRGFDSDGVWESISTEGGSQS